jgi:hypothetical protein
MAQQDAVVIKGGQARGPRSGDEELLKDDIRRRVEAARESVAEAVSEIREAATEKYESIKDAVAECDWRDEVKKHPAAWSLGALGVGLLAGCAVSGAIKRARRRDRRRGYVPSVPHAYAAQPIIGEHDISADAQHSVPVKVEKQNREPVVVDDVKASVASDHVRRELTSLRGRLIDELSAIAHEVLLPALIRKIREALVADKPKAESIRRDA